jgi:hypothetical protein
MSWGNPHENAPNPSTRWFEWNGEKGLVRYYDKEAKTNMDVALPFKFLLLDQLGSVRGWHELSKSGIHSNEVRDTRADILIVKAFKAGVLAQGIYRDIKDRVNAVGGSFNANCYIAFKNGNEMSIGSIRFKGAALGAWMEFTKAHRGELTKKAVVIHGTTEGKKGRIIYRMPAFTTADVAPEAARIATALDAELQAWLAGYLKRNLADRVAAPVAHVPDEDFGGEPPPDEYFQSSPVTADDIPF